MKHQMQAFVAAYNSGRLDEAERIARSLVSFDRHNSRYGLLLGVTLLRLGRSREAVEALQSASIRSPKDADILNALAAALNAAGRSAEAVGVCRQALACRPNSPDVLNNLGNALQQRGALDKAIETYRKALSFKPNHIDALYNLGAELCGAVGDDGVRRAAYRGG